MNLLMNFVYGFVVHYLFFFFFYRFLLEEIRRKIRVFVSLNLIFLIIMLFISFFIVFLTLFLHPVWRILLFFIRFALLASVFYFLFFVQNWGKSHKFHISLMYPYAIVLIMSSLFLLDFDSTFTLNQSLTHNVVGFLSMWLSMYMVFVYEEKFVLTHTLVGVQNRMRILLSVILFYIIFSSLIK